MQPSVERQPCRIAFLFSDFVSIDLGSMQTHRNSLCSLFHYLQFFTASFFMIALPMLLTRVLFALTVEVNSMLKLRFTVPGMMTSSLPKFGNLTSSSSAWSISLGLLVTLTFVWFLLFPYLF